MPAPVTGKRTQRFLVAPEATAGTAETVVDTRLSALRVAVSPMKETEYFAPQGDALPSLMVVNDDYTNIAVTGKLSFHDVCYVLCSLFGDPTITSLGGTAYSWVWDWDGTEVVDPQTYTVSYGDVNRARRIAGFLFNTLAFAVARDGSLEMTSNGFGEAMETGWVSYPRQSIFTIVSTASGGTYTITWAGQTTGAIAYNASIGTVQTALEALSNVAAASADLVVTGTPSSLTITPTSTGAFAATDVTASVNPGSLTGGTATMTETQVGGPVNTVVAVPMFPLMFDLFIDDTWAGLGSTRVGTIYSWDMAINERFARARPINSLLTTDGIVETEGDEAGQNHTLGFTAAADAFGESVIDDIDNGTIQFVRLEANGAADSIDAGHAFKFRVDFGYFVGEIGEYGTVQGGVHSMPFTGRIAKDPVTSNGIKVTIYNEISGL